MPGSSLWRGFCARSGLRRRPKRVHSRASDVRHRAILAARNRNPVLLGDIVGTNLRFALCDRGIVGPVKSSPTASYKNLLDAIDTFLAAELHGGQVRHALLAVAGPVRDGQSVPTNSP